jgi:hypothetical protein
MFQTEINFALLQQTGKHPTVAIEKWHFKKKKIRKSKYILTILPPVIPPVN